MQSLLFLSLSILPLVLGIPTSDAALSKRTPGNIFMCNGENWSGDCHNVFFPLGQCIQVPDEYIGTTGSAGPDAGAICTMFDASHSTCGGTGLAILQRPGESDLYHENGNPGGNVKFIRCNTCTACT